MLFTVRDNYSFILVLICTVFFSGFSSTCPPCVPSIIDNDIIFQIFGVDSTVFPYGEGEFGICLNTCKNYTLILFHNGTQIAELDSTHTEETLSEYNEILIPLLKPGKRNALKRKNTSIWKSVFNKKISAKEKKNLLLDCGYWPEGFFISKDVNLSASGSSVLNNSLELKASKNIGFISTKAGLRIKWHHGKLADNLIENSRDNFRKHAFSFSLGVPFIRYELSQAGWLIPEYFWLEENVNHVYDHTAQPVILSQLDREWSRTNKKNISHSFNFKFSRFNYFLLFDKEIYRKPVMKFELDSLEAPGSASWGTSLTFAYDTWIPGIRLRLSRFNFNMLPKGKYFIPVSIMPLEFYLYYWNPKRYSLGCDMEISIDLKKSG